jgi:hypothetical protein
MAERKRRWVPIAIGIAFLLVCLGIGAVVVVVSLFRENVETRPANIDEATAAFEEVRRAFGERAPLLEIRDGRPQRVDSVGRAASSVKLQHMKIIVWDPDDNHLARLTLPFWLLRLKTSPIEFGAYASGIDDDEGSSLRVEDLEAYGPGIVLEHTSSRGERLLVWQE